MEIYFGKSEVIALTNMTANFPATVSYYRFTELVDQNLLAMSLFLKTCCLGECRGIYFLVKG